MRIIGGELSGRRLLVSSKMKMRPTTDISREALFNILTNRYHFEKLTILDLFSGTGSISFEFFSRGATNITCVETNSLNINYIKRNSDNLGINNLKIIHYDALSFLLKSESNSYDIIFADPPFDLPNRFKISEYVFARNLLKPNGLLIIEHEPKDSYQNSSNFLELRKYGKVNFSFFG